MKKIGLVVSIMMLLAGASEAATRRGVFYTQEELDIWAARAVSGPYKATGDVQTNSPGDWNRLAGMASTSLSGNRWAGYTSCPTAGNMTGAPGNSQGEQVLATAFYSLVADSATHRTAVRNELIAQAGTAGTNFANTSLWCATGGTGDPILRVAGWVMKLVNAYDYVRPQLSGGDQDTLDAWFDAIGVFFNARAHSTISTRWPNRDTDDYSSSPYGNFNVRQILYFGGPGFTEWSAAWDNNIMSANRVYGVIGQLTDNATLKARAKRTFEEYIKYGTFYTNTSSIATAGEYYRWGWGSNVTPGTGFGYPSASLLYAVMVADAFARNGDTSLYDYSTTVGFSTAGTQGGPKTLKALLTTHYRMMDHQITRYGNLTSTTDPNRIIDQLYEPDNWHTIGDLWSATIANNYYKEAYFKTIYLRTAPLVGGGTVAGYPSNPVTSGWYPWGGSQGVFPGLLFMFGNMADNQTAHPGLDPYNLSADTLAPKPPTGFTVTAASATQINLAWTKPTENTDDSSYTDPGGFRIRFCQNAGCNPAVGTIINVGDVAAYNHTGLVSETVYRYDLTAFDVNSNFSTVFTPVQEDTTDAAPPPTPVAYWRFDESGATTTAQDDTANNFDGLLCEGATCTPVQGPTWVTGQVNNALRCDGINDNVQVADAAALDIVGDLTVAFWFKLLSTTNIPSSATGASATVLTKEDSAGSGVAPYLIRVHTTSAPIFRFYHSPGGKNFTSYVIPCGAVGACTNTDFHHATIVRDTVALTLKLYIDGNIIQTIPYTGTAAATSAPVRLCTDSIRASGSYAHMALDELRLYNGILDDMQIASLAGQAPGATPVLAQNTWCWKNINALEADTCQGPALTRGTVVADNQVQLRTAVLNTGDTSPLSAYALYCRTPAGSGTWWALDGDCSANPLCYGFSVRRDSGDSTQAQLTVGGSTFLAGGKFYELFANTADMVAIGADQHIEREHAVRVREDVSAGTTFGCCERRGDGTELDSCTGAEEATLAVVAPFAYRSR